MWIYSLLVLSILVCIWYVKLFFSYIEGWKSLQVLQKDGLLHEKVSVIIPFRNEEEQLPALLQKLDQQNYPWATYILINDHSTDNSVSIVEQWVPKTGAHQLIHLESMHGKKQAVKTGIQAAETEWILCTDADTLPHMNWVQTMLHAALSRDAEFVSGPVAIQPGNTFFSKWQALEFAGLIGIGAAAIQLSNPNMCNGANILYRKSSYERIRGFEGNEHVPGGDDQFLMHRIFNENPEAVMFCKSEEALVWTKPEQSIQSFLNQRIRWASKNGAFERRSVSLEMMGVWFFYFLIVTLFLCAVLSPIFLLAASLLFMTKYWIERRYYVVVLPFFGMTDLKRNFLLSELFQLPYVLITGILGKFGSYQWKGRKYNV